MFHFPDRLYNRNHVINRIPSFIHDFKDDLAAFSPVYRMITVIVNKANLAQFQLSQLLLSLCPRFKLRVRLPLSDFRNVSIFLYRVRFRSSQRIPYRCTGNGANNISNGRAAISAPPATIIISDKSAYRTSQTSPNCSTTYNCSGISHTSRCTSAQYQSRKQNYS